MSWNVEFNPLTSWPSGDCTSEHPWGMLSSAGGRWTSAGSTTDLQLIQAESRCLLQRHSSSCFSASVCVWFQRKGAHFVEEIQIIIISLSCKCFVRLLLERLKRKIITFHFEKFLCYVQKVSPGDTDSLIQGWSFYVWKAPSCEQRSKGQQVCLHWRRRTRNLKICRR